MSLATLDYLYIADCFFTSPDSDSSLCPMCPTAQFCLPFPHTLEQKNEHLQIYNPFPLVCRQLSWFYSAMVPLVREPVPAMFPSLHLCSYGDGRLAKNA